MQIFIRLFQLTVFFIALTFFTTLSLAAETVHLHLKDAKGKIYKCNTDATGKFSFPNVEPGKYELIWVLPDGTTPDNTESCSIEIQSFSWGASNTRTVEPAAQAAVPVGGSSRPNGPSGGPPSPDHTPPPAANQGGQGDNSGAKGTAAKKSRSNISNNFAPSDLNPTSNGKYYVVVLQDVVISGVTTCEGTCSKMAINEKGVPGKKKKPSTN